MKWSLKPVIWLILGISVVSFLLAYYQVGEERRRLEGDMESDGAAVAQRLEEAVQPRLAEGSREELQRQVERFANRERLAGAAVFDDQGQPLAATSGAATQLPARIQAVTRAMQQNKGAGQFLRLQQMRVHLYALPLSRPGAAGAVTLIVLQDASYIDRQRARIWRDTYLGVLVQMLLIGLTALLVVRWSVMEPIARTAQWIRAVRSGKGAPQASLPQGGLLQPLAAEVTGLAKSLEAARDAAAKEARLREAADSLWTAERLAAHVRKKLQGNRLLVVSNREPYMHRHSSKGVEVLVPASGLVTALEPILR